MNDNNYDVYFQHNHKYFFSNINIFGIKDSIERIRWEKNLINDNAPILIEKTLSLEKDYF